MKSPFSALEPGAVRVSAHVQEGGLEAAGMKTSAGVKPSVCFMASGRTLFVHLTPAIPPPSIRALTLSPAERGEEKKEKKQLIMGRRRHLKTFLIFLVHTVTPSRATVSDLLSLAGHRNGGALFHGIGERRR